MASEINPPINSSLFAEIIATFLVISGFSFTLIEDFFIKSTTIFDAFSIPLFNAIGLTFFVLIALYPFSIIA